MNKNQQKQIEWTKMHKDTHMEAKYLQMKARVKEIVTQMQAMPTPGSDVMSLWWAWQDVLEELDNLTKE